jgi:hypothetical protein
MVRSGRYILGMEIIWAKFSSLGTWETSVVVYVTFAKADPFRLSQPE